MQSNSQIIAEEKPIKRIGYASLIDQKKLEALMPESLVGRLRQRLAGRRGVVSWRSLLDLKRYTLEQRFSILRSLGVLEHQLIFDNITPTVGFEALVKAMTGNIASIDEIGVNVHALGSGTTAASSSDTELDNETTRALLSSRSYNGNKAYYTAFYGLSDAVGTHHEMGLFINADDGTPDDGVLWDRTLLDLTKTGAQSLTIDYEDTFSNG